MLGPILSLDQAGRQVAVVVGRNLLVQALAGYPVAAVVRRSLVPVRAAALGQKEILPAAVVAAAESFLMLVEVAHLDS